MKKVVLSLAGVLAAGAFAPEASALPVFARQTGMACSGCHFNHAPLLNAFGRSFKSSGYTLMGAQGKIEGENVSIPDTLNMGVLATAGYEKIQNTQGKWSLPSSGGELSIFYGGRITDNMGFLSELSTVGAAAATGAAKLLWMPEVGGAKIGLVLDTNNGQGVAHGFEVLNTGAVNVHKIAIGQTHINAYSAAQWMGTNNATTGVSLVGSHETGFFNFSAYDVAPQSMGAGASNMPLHYGRLAGLFDVAGFDMGAGVQRWYGNTNAIQFNVAQAAMLAGKYDATVFDVQAQGEIAGMSTGLYASYGVAPVGSMFGQGTLPIAANAFKAKSLNMAMDMNVGFDLIARAALRRATNGQDGLADNAVMIGVIYEYAQNVELHLTRTNNYGDHYNPAMNAAATGLGKATTSLLAEILF
ncbi:hypothetical protein GALL_25910 [mine drainage metagenome]|uniref:Cytochrome c domain-containing protein n=1 Tax=mine drainage metagenome TaxID=410659 RepID=A0A1J5TSS1_9ZZZZ